uniref:Uncharacterized protein n=1 Tax=Palpitomonas bilix TaxID=652834 RepID=A0A7S3GJZ8_9EUKA|mmetsp:Transcript_6707/g.16812  ORF Transcript_6707/g.16812 Transcript_6707/m.16812 type:complete len:328 (+) Transcript_6707:180-1163(+)
MSHAFEKTFYEEYNIERIGDNSEASTEWPETPFQEYSGLLGDLGGFYDELSLSSGKEARTSFPRLQEKDRKGGVVAHQNSFSRDEAAQASPVALEPVVKEERVPLQEEVEASEVLQTPLTSHHGIAVGDLPAYCLLYGDKLAQSVNKGPSCIETREARDVKLHLLLTCILLLFRKTFQYLYSAGEVYEEVGQGFKMDGKTLTSFVKATLKDQQRRDPSLHFLSGIVQESTVAFKTSCRAAISLLPNILSFKFKRTRDERHFTVHVNTSLSLLDSGSLSKVEAASLKYLLFSRHAVRNASAEASCTFHQEVTSPQSPVPVARGKKIDY